MVEILGRYLEARPGDGAVHTRLADACRKSGQRDLAARHYRAALALDPRNRYALMGLGDLHLKGNRPAEALACYEALLELDPSLVTIHTIVGNLHRKRLAFEPAARRFRAALALEPGNPDATFGLADSLRGMGRFEEAAPLWESILLLDPRNQQVLTRAGDCFYRLGRQDRAVELFGRAAALGYDKPALLGLATLCRLRAEPAQALGHYLTILDRNPGDARTSRLAIETLLARQGPQARAYLEAQGTAHPGVTTLAGALDQVPTPQG